MKKAIIYLVLPVSLLSCKQKAKEPEIITEIGLTAVKVAAVKMQAVSDSLNVSGLLTTENEARLSFKTSGVVDHIYVHEGQVVKKGQLLASLKPTEINSLVEQSNLGLEKARRDYTRLSNLYKDSVITLEVLENAKTSLDMAKKSVEAVVFNRQYAYIKAENEGFITAKIANEGEVISAGAPVLSMDETNGNKDFLLRVGVNDPEWAAIYTGQRASVSFDAFPGKQLTGTVYRKLKAADAASGSFQVDIRVNFSSESPASGMFGKATLVPLHPLNKYTVPYEALIQVNGSDAFVYVPAKDHAIERRTVTIKSFNEKEAVIASGLKEGDQVIISNNAFLNEKSKIAIAR
jgi:RND family efflux transporter MFP subunit